MSTFSLKINPYRHHLIGGFTGGYRLLSKFGLFYTESPLTRDAKFTADVVAIAPDVSGLITDVPVKDNQLRQKGQILFVIDQPRYQQALFAEADVAHYQTLAAEKQRGVRPAATFGDSGDVTRRN